MVIKKKEQKMFVKQKNDQIFHVIQLCVNFNALFVFCLFIILVHITC